MQTKIVAVALLVILLACISATKQSSALVASKTYTLDADFNQGVLFGVEHNTVHDQLQLSRECTTFPFIWVPNDEGTVSKVDTTTGKELGRYWVSNGSDSSPSRTTVDLLGNCYVGCRQRGTVVKIGSYATGQWIDRNEDDHCQTSKDLDNDGNIEAADGEILPWGQDECVLYELVLVPGSEGTYVPGTYPGPYDTDFWGTAPRGLAVDRSNNLWVGTWGTMKYYYVDGATGTIVKTIDISPHSAYGAVLDGNGILWSAEPSVGEGAPPSFLLRLDTSTDSFTAYDLGHVCYGLALDYSNHLWVTGWDSQKWSRIDILSYPITYVTYDVPEQWNSRGVVATSDGSIWVANSGGNNVLRYDNNGNLLATIPVNYPTGVSVDAEGKVWTTERTREYLYRIDPTANMIDLTKQIVGSIGHYSYSDMTGMVARTITTKIGTWNVVFDSEATDTPWGKISWNSYEPEETSIMVKVRSSNDQTAWSAWEPAVNGVALSATPNGRYLEIETTLQIFAGEVSPILYDLTAQLGPLRGDVNYDGRVDMRDIGLCCNTFGSSSGDPNWDPDHDTNRDGRVDMRDIGIVCSNFGKHYP